MTHYTWKFGVYTLSISFPSWKCLRSLEKEENREHGTHKYPSPEITYSPEEGKIHPETQHAEKLFLKALFRMPSGPNMLHKTRRLWLGLGTSTTLSLSEGMFAVISTNGWTVNAKWWAAGGAQSIRQNCLYRNGDMMNSISRTKHAHGHQHADNIPSICNNRLKEK